MTAGKNKLLRWARIYVGGYDLSGDARTLTRLDNLVGEVDITGWNNSVRYSLGDGLRTVGVRGFQALMNDATAGAYTRLIAADRANYPVSVLLGGGAEPTYNDIAYLINGVGLGEPGGWDGQAAALTADFVPYDATGPNPWGVVISPATSQGATFSGTANNNGASSANGWHANLHVTASSGGTWSLIVQHSTTGAWAGEEATLTTFTANGSAITSEHKSGTGTVNQYIRFRGVRSSGTVTPLCTFARL